MEMRDRLANLALLGVAIAAWAAVGVVVVTRDPFVDHTAGYAGAALMGLAVALTAAPLAWLLVFARHRRIAYRGDWIRALRRGGWVGLLVATLVVLRVVDAFGVPIVLFLTAIFVLAEITLSAER
jgi:hypothetical protein